MKGTTQQVTPLTSADWSSTDSTLELLHAISELQSGFISDSSPNQIFDDLLARVLAITKSEYGFIGRVLHNPKGQPYLKTFALTNIAWNDETRAFYATHAPHGMEFVNLNTLFGYTLTTNEPVIANDPATDPRAGGLPEGHPPMHAYLGLPLFRGGEMVGMAGIANRPGGYDQSLLDFLKPLQSTCANIIDAWRLDVRRRETEKALRASEAQAKRLSLVASRTINGVIITDTAGNIEWTNDGFARLTGYQLDEIVGKRPGEMLHGKDTDQATVKRMRTALKARRAVRETILNYRKDGEAYWVDLDIMPLFEDDGAFSGFMAVETNVTQKVQADNALRAYAQNLEETTAAHLEKAEMLARTVDDLHIARRRAEEAVRAKADFLARMSHEMRTPLNGVIGMTGFLLETALSEEQRDFASVIQTSGDILLSTISDILDYSRIESGHLELEERVFDPVSLVEEAADIVAHVADEKGVLLTLHAESTVPTRQTGDRTRLRQVVVNIIANAVKFTQAGEVHVHITVSDTTSEELRVAVRDTGIGIPAGRIPALFESFVQADTSTTRRFGGTGLGLAISRHLVEMMGGRIEVESVEGEGSLFTVIVPIVTGEFAMLDNDLHEGSVLIVDRDPLRGKRLAEQCEAFGFEARVQHEFDVDSGEVEPFVLANKSDISRETLIELERRGSRVAVLAPRGEHVDTSLATLRLVRPVRPRAVSRFLGLSETPEGSQRAETLPKVKGRGAEHVAVRVLVAEDNQVNRRVLVRHLELTGYQADTANNGVEAFEMAENGQYSLILMDVQMPIMDGLEAARKLRSIQLDAPPHIIAVTANAFEEDREQCIAAGMDDYLSKPVRPAELRRALDRFLARYSEFGDDGDSSIAA